MSNDQCEYIHTHTHTHTKTYMNSNLSHSACLCIYVYTYTYTYIHMNVCIYACLCPVSESFNKPLATYASTCMEARVYCQVQTPMFPRIICLFKKTVAASKHCHLQEELEDAETLLAAWRKWAAVSFVSFRTVLQGIQEMSELPGKGLRMVDLAGSEQSRISEARRAATARSRRVSQVACIPALELDTWHEVQCCDARVSSFE